MIRGLSAVLAGRRLAVLAAACVAAAVAVAATGAASGGTVIARDLANPRGIDVAKYGNVTTVETATGDITQVSAEGDPRTVATLPGAVDVALGGFLNTLVVTGGPPPEEEDGEEAGAAQAGAPPPASLLRVFPGGKFAVLADIGAYQQTDPDPDDQDDFPEESNPNGLAILSSGSTLVTDAANNDLLEISRNGTISTVARFKRELVPFPALDDPPPDFPPAGTLLPAEAVPTAVAVGPDGAWYVSELKGFPFSPGTSRIWRIEPGSRNAVCDPEAPTTGPCTTFATGFTGIIDIRFGPDGTLYVVEIAKAGLLVAEGGGDPTGALWALKRGTRTELVPGTLTLPGGVAVSASGTLYVTTGTFGPFPGTVVQIRTQ
jgi:hypothetical protein